MGNLDRLPEPLIYLSDPSMYTLMLGQYTFFSAHAPYWSQLMAANVMILAPLVVLFSHATLLHRGRHVYRAARRHCFAQNSSFDREDFGVDMVRVVVIGTGGMGQDYISNISRAWRTCAWSRWSMFHSARRSPLPRCISELVPAPSFADYREVLATVGLTRR